MLRVVGWNAVIGQKIVAILDGQTGRGKIGGVHRDGRAASGCPCGGRVGGRVGVSLPGIRVKGEHRCLATFANQVNIGFGNAEFFVATTTAQGNSPRRCRFVRGRVQRLLQGFVMRQAIHQRTRWACMFVIYHRVVHRVGDGYAGAAAD